MIANRTKRLVAALLLLLLVGWAVRKWRGEPRVMDRHFEEAAELSEIDDSATKATTLPRE